MRDPRENCSPPNAFDRQFLDVLARRDPAPAVPEADNAGPWQVTRLHGHGPTRWACIARGERPPRFGLQEPDVAHMVAAGCSMADRPTRFQYQVDAAGTLHLMNDGHSVGTARQESESLPLHLTGLDHLRADPLALAHLLVAVPDGVLERAGTIVMEMVSRSTD